MITLLFIIQAFAKISNYHPQIIKEWINANEKLYLGFSSNRGQINKEALLYSKGPGFNVYITQKGLSFTIFSFEKENSKISKTDNKPIKENIKVWRIDYDLIGGNIKKENIVFENEIPNYYENFYNENTPYGILFIKLYRKVRIKEVYPGIDWILRYDENGNFHHEFEASPNSNIAQIRIKVKNAEIEITDEGKSVLLKTPIGTIKDGNLIAYEGNREIKVKYSLSDNLLSFKVHDYSNQEKLIIDPYTLVWSTYYGGGDFDHGNYLASDQSGNIFLVGYTASINFPVYNPGGGAYYQGTCGGCPTYYDAFILKFNNNGSRLWATYYGGSNYDFATSVDADAFGNIFVVGGTWSSNFPTYNPGGGAYFDGTCGTDGNCNYDGISYKSDAFILKFDNNGIRLWATYYGGSDYEWECGTSFTFSGSAQTYDYCSLKVDYNNNLIVVGMTRSSDFPTYDPGGGAYHQTCHLSDFDAFILKFSNSGQRLWATCYGGSNWDYARSVAVDNSNNIFVVGFKVYSSDFPVYNPGGGAYFQSCSGSDWDIFILKFNSAGVRLWATCYGGSNHEWADGVVVDNLGRVYVVGGTWSSDFPLQNLVGAYFDNTFNSGDAYILRFSNSGVLQWATYFGGSMDEANPQHSIATDGNNIYIIGNTNSNDFFTYNPGGGAYFQNSLAGGRDAFISAFNSNGQLLWSTYFGGNGDECYYLNCHLTIGGTSLFITGLTSSNNLPLQNYPGSYYQPNNAGGYDAFISKFSDITPVNVYESLISSIKIIDKRVIIKLNGELQGDFKVYTITGNEVTKGDIVSNQIAFEVQRKGIYIIKFKDRSIKIVVK
jgi:hypothetical protein